MIGGVLICLIIFTSTTNAANSDFSLTLIHRDSPLSPFHNPNLTRYELNQAKFDRAIAYELALSVAPSSPKLDPITPQLIPQKGEYLVRFAVGDPPVPVHAIFDTGSSFIWFQCQPCQKCFPQKDPIYDPVRSEPAMSFQCTDALCNSTPSPSCGPDQKCTFLQEYLDGTFTEGELKRDTFAFEGPNGATVSGLPLVFGCSHNSIISNPDDWADGDRAGIVGMGRDTLSMATQLGQPAFAYCLLGEPQQSMTSRVQIGASPRMWGNSTAMLGGNSTEMLGAVYYVAMLESISLGAQRVVDVPSGHQVTLDSGTTMTYLEPELFDPVLDTVKGLMKGFEVKSDPEGRSELCYGATTKGLIEAGLPVIELGFVGGAKLEVNVESLFLEVAERLVCISFRRSTVRMTIIGNIAQQNNVVGYDLVNERIYMSGAFDCRMY
ncbi:Aspartic proteinase CDR1 [Acorus calamus]|uniref:Aspartic proteinase CDR1 n=1 Tax=Acorus calamus TaxID=4465 RepID=A0AAV9C8D2_ACOCL|nr:Aspartic proteinase CDR1 [Acorus calamus]